MSAYKVLLGLGLALAVLGLLGLLGMLSVPTWPLIAAGVILILVALAMSGRRRV